MQLTHGRFGNALPTGDPASDWTTMWATQKEYDSRRFRIAIAITAEVRRRRMIRNTELGSTVLAEYFHQKSSTV
jgi:hypothetical protein